LTPDFGLLEPELRFGHYPIQSALLARKPPKQENMMGRVALPTIVVIALIVIAILYFF